MMELKPRDTKMLQALSVLAMVCLHLFCTLDYSDKYIPLIYVGGVPLCYYLGQFSDFCVFGFAFCSGYGHMVNYGTERWYRKRIKGLMSVLCSYWIVLIVFSVISILTGHRDYMPGTIYKFVTTALTVESYYNGAWWYMFAYVIVVAISPLLMKFVKNVHPIVVLVATMILYCIAYYIRFDVITSNWFLLKFGPVGMTIAEYLMGAVCFQYQMLSKGYKFLNQIPKILRTVFTITTLGLLIYIRARVVQTLFVAPISGFILMAFFHYWEKPHIVERFFLFIGKHSTNIWLTHMFFYLVLFEGFVYKAKYPVLIYLFMLTITIVVSLVLQLMERPFQKIIASIN